MTIEKSPPSANTTKAASGQPTHGAKAKAAGTDAPADGATGFMAILGAMGDAATEDTATPLAVAADAAAVDAAPVAVVPFDATLLLQQNPQIAAAQALQKAATQAGDTNAADPSFSVPVGLQTPALPLDANKPLTAVAMPLQAEPTGQEGQASVRGLRPANASGTNATVQLAQPATDAAPESLTQALQRGGARSKVGHDFAQSAKDADAPGNAVASVSTERVDVKDAKLMAALDPGKSPLPSRNMEPILVPLVVKQEKSQGERTTFAVKQSEPTYSGTALGVSGPDFSSSAALAPAMASDMQVAEQVTYWVSQNVQNAEMKLDGLGHSPVEVSISVQGNEAQIAFRSDEALTRGVLESAGAHLKDMLQREGMVLTGVSVGTSGSGDAGGNERRARQPVRQATIAPLKAASPDAVRGSRLQNGQTVDLFV